MPRKRTSPIWTIKKEELESIIQNSRTYSEVLNNFGLTNKGGNCKTLKNRCKSDSIDLSGLGVDIYRNRRKSVEKKPLSDYLVENSTYNRTHLKKRLIEEKILVYICSCCGSGPEWNNKSLSLVLDHINGVSDDNRIDNLRFLCPNCNSQTSTFAGKNVKRRQIEVFCNICNIKIWSKSKTGRCRRCLNKIE